MAITATVAEIAAAIRVGSTSEETTEVGRIRDYAIIAISQHLGDAYDDAPSDVVNMAATLLTGWLYERPTTTAGVGFANAIKFSGAVRTLFPYKVHNVGLVGGDMVAVAQAAVGTTGNPVTDVAIMGAELVVTFADGSTETHDLPAGGGGTVDQVARDSVTAAQATADAAQGEIDSHELNHPDGSTDQTARDAATAAQTTADGAITEIKSHEADTHNTDGTARDAAAAAQSTADSAATSAGTAQTTADTGIANAAAAQSTADGKIDADAATALITAHTLQHFAHHTPPHVGEGGGVVNIINGRLPGPVVAMQFGWNQSQTHAASIFTRANDHPIDGAAVGMSDGLALPPFPPSLATDLTLYLHLWVEGTPDVAAIRRDASTDPMDVAEVFPGSLSGSLTVGGVAGTVYVSNVRLASMEGVVYDVLIAGAEIATVTDTTRYAATFGLLTDLAAGTWANYTSGLDAGEIFKHGAFAVVTAAGRDKLMIPTTGVYSVKAMVVGIIDVGASTDRAWLETRLVRTRGGVEVAQAPVGVLGYARNQLGVPAQTLTSAVDGYYELESNDQIHLEAMLSSQDVTNLLDLTSGYLGLVKF